MLYNGSEETSFNFVYADIPNYKAQWYLKISSENLNGLVEIIEWLKGKLGGIYSRQLEQLLEGKIKESNIHNPFLFIDNLTSNVIKTLEQGKTLLWASDANRFELNENVTVLKEIKTDNYQFPDIEEVINIAKGGEVSIIISKVICQGISKDYNLIQCGKQKMKH